MPPIGELTRIEQVHLDRLEHQGVFTTGMLRGQRDPDAAPDARRPAGRDTNDVLAWRDEA